MISIYTHTNNPLKKEFWKWVIKKILRKYSGPDAVLDSLVRGLNELKIPFEVNPGEPKYKIIHILSGTEILKKQIEHKCAGQTLIVGPTVVVAPTDYGSIILDKNIDIILTPSKWVSDFYLSISPSIINKTYSWPAGVSIPEIESTRDGKVIIFKKNVLPYIFKNVQNILDAKSIPYEVLEYGQFSHKEYLNKLKNTPYLIYLQQSESQGLALQEAWSYNVPTLVYKSTNWTMGKYSWTDPLIAAPYLSPECGLFFTTTDFEDIILNLDNKTFEPKKYCRLNLSDKSSAKQLLNIIEIYNEKNH